MLIAFFRAYNKVALSSLASSGWYIPLENWDYE
jgi:hypothetical protein